MSGIEILTAALSSAQAISSGMQRAKMQRQQAAVAQQQASYQRQLTDAEVARKRRAAALQLGAQRARLAGNGIDLTRGSALMVQEDLAAESELDALMIRSQGYNRAYSSDIAAGNARLNASNTQTSTALGAATSLLSRINK